MIIFFSYFYTAVVFNPQETADNLKKYGGFIPGIRPGSATADYFDHVLTRLTTVGGLYLTAVCRKPSQATSPRTKRCCSRRARKVITTGRLIRRKSPTSTGMATPSILFSRR